LNGRFKGFAVIALAACLGALPAGCTYDYLQNTDRVGYKAGNAVRSNIAMETTNPWRADMYDTRGLGKDGAVTEAVSSPSSSSTTTVSPASHP
jgi:hypothetical protein